MRDGRGLGMRKHTKALLELNTQKKEGVRTSFLLDKKAYQKFKVLCKSRGITPSHLIDSMIRDLLEEIGEGENN